MGELKLKKKMQVPEGCFLPVGVLVDPGTSHPQPSREPVSGLLLHETPRDLTPLESS